MVSPLANNGKKETIHEITQNYTNDISCWFVSFRGSCLLPSLSGRLAQFVEAERGIALLQCAAADYTPCFSFQLIFVMVLDDEQSIFG